MPVDTFRASYECRLLTGAAAIGAAKRLQGAAYVRHGHLPARALTGEGWLPWHDRVAADRVRWFGVLDQGGGLVAVASTIAVDGRGLASLPAVALMDTSRSAALMDTSRSAEAVGMFRSAAAAGGLPLEWLRRLPAERVVEISGVAKAPHAPLAATMHVYKAIYRDSERRGEHAWVMSVIPELRVTLERVAPGGITVGARPLRMADLHPEVRPDVLAYPVWGAVDGFTARIRAAADAQPDPARRDFLHGSADFLDDRNGG